MRKFIFPLYVTMMTCVASTSLHASGAEEAEAAHSSTAHLAPSPLASYINLAKHIYIDLARFQEDFPRYQAAVTMECRAYADYLTLSKLVREEQIRSAKAGIKRKGLKVEELDVERLEELSDAAWEARIKPEEEIKLEIAEFEGLKAYYDALSQLKGAKKLLTDGKRTDLKDLAGILPAADVLPQPTTQVILTPQASQREKYEEKESAFYSELNKQLEKLVSSEEAIMISSLDPSSPLQSGLNDKVAYWALCRQQKTVAASNAMFAASDTHILVVLIEEILRTTLKMLLRRDI